MSRRILVCLAAAAMAGASVGCSSGARDPGEGPAAEQRTTVERSELRERAIEVLEEAAFSEWAILRANAIEGLQEAPSRVVGLTRSGLADESVGVRYVAAMTAGKLRLTELAPAVEPLVRDPDETVRAAAMYALARMGAPVDQTPMATWLVTGPAERRMRVAYVIGELGEPSAAPLVRDAAWRLMRERGSMTAAQSNLLRLQLTEALVKLGERDELSTLRGALYPSTIEELEAAVLAAQMLGGLGDEGSARQLVVLIETRRGRVPGYDPDAEGPFQYPPELRLAAARSLAIMGHGDGGFVADEFAEAEGEALRAQAAFVYGAVGSAGSVARLEGMLDDESGLVRVAAAAAVLEALAGGRPGG